MITSAVASGEFSQHTEQMVADSIALIKKNSLEKQRNSLLNRIRLLNPSTQEDKAMLDELIAQKMDIDNRLSKKE